MYISIYVMFLSVDYTNILLISSGDYKHIRYTNSEVLNYER